MSTSPDGAAGKVVVTHALHTEAYTRLREQCAVDMNTAAEPWSRDTLRGKLRDADAVVAFMTDRIDRDLLESAPRLRIVAGALKGADNIDMQACSERDVWVSVVPDLLTAPTAELAIGLMIGLGRNVLPGDRHVRSGAFSGWRPRFYGTGIHGSVVGLLGLGAIGRAMAQRLQGFGARVLYHDRRPPAPGEELTLGLESASFERLLRQSDFVVVCLPLSGETVHMLNRDTLALMKPGALVINPSRGSVVCEADIVEALQQGNLGGYAADVFEMEDWARGDRPQGVTRELLEMDGKTLLTPHLGSAVHEARKAIESEAVANVLDVLHGQVPRGAANALQGRGADAPATSV
ncbi:phosphonate dehydrogenase [Aquisalimonas lutea]|uniref:phosphonate dehydrogenase n=1 Tax=Aquisalimonas lutea TaxID=1327750 RepID=UPI0025B5707B|nr:phosphonate dehydrogenase [Aquisalimonas lutea]MDN3519158.1 phosphonate dehydrogenase [Aquisalimonas lutea]